MLTVKCPACEAEFPADIQSPLSALNDIQIYGNKQECPACGNAIVYSTSTLHESLKEPH